MSTLISPLRGLRPLPEHAADVAAPPYDVLNSEEARLRARGRPFSFLHISKPEIDLPEETDPHASEVYERGATNLRRLVEDGILVRDESPCYYVYRLSMQEHVQTGLVCAASVAAYDSGRIRKHEFTRPDKEDDRVRQITALNAQTGPVLLAYRASDELRELLADLSAGPPLYDLVGDGDIGHTIWKVDDAATITRLSDLFESMDRLYIADGHHRSAAASRVAAARRTAVTPADGPASFDYFLSVAFPHDEMQILDYNRVVRDLNGLGKREFLEEIGKAFTVTPLDDRRAPSRPEQFSMYLDGRWYRLDIHQSLVPRDDPVASLDVSLLQDHLLHPVLAIGDPRTDSRIDFVGGIRGLAELQRRVDSGEMSVAFALYPTGMEALMAVADAGEVMPPKSTWFEPKLADGLVSHVLD